MRIKSKTFIGKRHVWDLTVDEHHNFVAEGVVVHNSGARTFCMEAKPYDIPELGAITAIYRPGPLKANVHKKYVATKKKVLAGEKIEYPHPLVEEVLSETMGFQVFQEHWMILAQKLAKFTPGESDKLRKTLVKKSLDTLDKKADEKEIARQKFIEGGVKYHDIPRSSMQKLWDEMKFFSLYGFNKSVTFDTLIDTYDENGAFVSTEEIQNVSAGTYVRSRDEETQEEIFTKVVENHYHGKIPTFEITLETGESVTCTLDHKFRVEDGRMLPLWMIIQEDLSIVSVGKNTKEQEA